MDAAQFLQPDQRPDQRGRFGESGERDGRNLRAIRPEYADRQRAELLLVSQPDVLLVPDAASGKTVEPADRLEPCAGPWFGLRSAEFDCGRCGADAADPPQIAGCIAPHTPDPATLLAAQLCGAMPQSRSPFI